MAKNNFQKQRSSIYAFSSQKELKKYFKHFFSGKEIEQVLKTARKGFVERVGTPEEETELQFIKKCELILLHKVRNSGF
ncbi:MAG: hypothetical protein HQK83_12630 [Fibrobacteria bacterium]|nr:hypothetical protein [Fibrobacteria bacterium]